MKWLGAFLRMHYATAPDPEIARLLDQQRVAAASMRESRERLERLARDPVDAALHSIIKDL